MFSRSFRSIRPLINKRFQSHAAEASSVKPSTFTNKYNFDINPPQVHHYWNYYNGAALVLFCPAFLAVAYLFQYTGSNLEGYDGFIQYADSENSPLKTLKFGETQQPARK
ncbi:hypothetical protein HYPBUDRAFT_106251 [Hyphopichia burtonii NRRL Y-1933]|uniref:Uncharacterized protein n=1 Tax=Hyphopichia burtonii NRRL Y-1933 TaxID=984485 RepID=A0A1E4RNU6_9ASCO|nr:hypothetical protein HYPBUDRAFT_106251 [Hyphopichia burtonii NRRL Y-1933]ODV68929.1 hypothetical protein HYPBUDRAFT_106251 [Hyphopichia burtonii NRRL Y-1933]